MSMSKTTLSASTRPVPATIASFVAMDMMREANALAAAGRSIIHLETGQPSTGAARLVRQAATDAIAHETLGYTEALGLPELRARIAAHYGQKHGITIDPARVIATPGRRAVASAWRGRAILVIATSRRHWEWSRSRFRAWPRTGSSRPSRRWTASTA